MSPGHSKARAIPAQTVSAGGSTRAAGPATMPRIAVAQVLAGLLLLAERWSPLDHALASLLGWLLVAGGVLVAGRPWTPGAGRWIVRLAAIALLLGTEALPAWWRAGGVALAMLVASRTIGWPGRARIETLAATAGLLAIVTPWLDAAPASLRFQEMWAAAISSLVTAILRLPTSGGPSPLGFDAILAIGAFAVAARWSGHRVRAARLLGVAHLVPVGWAALLAFQTSPSTPAQLTLAPESSAWSVLATVWTATLAGWGPLVTGIALCALSPFVLWDWGPAAPQPQPHHRGGRLAVAVAVLALATAGGLAAWTDRPVTRRGVEFAIYERGYVNWLRPDSLSFGRDSGGMLGMLPDFLTAMGFGVRRISDLSRTTLGHARVLLFVNYEDRLTPEERSSVWGFVERGGHLLVFADHTWTRPAGRVVNALIEPSDIRLRDDSANFFVAGWSNGFRFLLQPLTAGLSPDGNDPAIVVGASLECGPRARPILLGRSGYSDAASLADSAGGYVGDLELGRGERVGDLVLAATQPYGLGRVTVFGDTSPLFNGITTSSHVFLGRLFPWAAAVAPEPRYDALFAYATMLGLVGLSLLARSESAAMALALAGCLAAGAGALGFRRMEAWPTAFVSGRIALIDESHLPASYPSGWEEDETGGLANNFMRNGYVTVFAQSLDDSLLDRAAVLAMVTPRRRIGRSTTRRLLGWVERGGQLILAAGAEEQEPSRFLLETLGVSIRPRPLGRVSARSAAGIVPMAEAWPIQLATGAAAETLLDVDGECVAARIRRGRGKVVLVADAQFFRNFNLEHTDHAHPANARFLARLLGDHDGGPGGRR